jgi:hypothetical protein
MPDITLPSLVVATGKSEFRLRCHAVAWAKEYTGQIRQPRRRYGRELPGLLLLSATGPDTAIKAVRATLYDPAVQAEFRLSGEDLHEQLSKATVAECKPVVYTAAVAKLASGVIHLVAVANVPGIMPNMSDDHLWSELTSPRYTTPLLRAWVPWLRETMVKSGSIVTAKGIASAAGVLRIDPEDLDALVSDGVKQGHLPLDPRGTPREPKRHQHTKGSFDELPKPARISRPVRFAGSPACQASV